MVLNKPPFMKSLCAALIMGAAVSVAHAHLATITLTIPHPQVDIYAPGVGNSTHLDAADVTITALIDTASLRSIENSDPNWTGADAIGAAWGIAVAGLPRVVFAGLGDDERHIPPTEIDAITSKDSPSFAYLNFFAPEGTPFLSKQISARDPQLSGYRLGDPIGPITVTVQSFNGVHGPAFVVPLPDGRVAVIASQAIPGVLVVEVVDAAVPVPAVPPAGIALLVLAFVGAAAAFLPKRHD